MILKTLSITIFALFNVNLNNVVTDTNDYYLRADEGYSYSFSVVTNDEKTRFNNEILKINDIEGSITITFDNGPTYRFDNVSITGPDVRPYVALSYLGQTLVGDLWWSSTITDGYISFDAPVIWDTESAYAPFIGVYKDGVEYITSAYLPPRTTIKTSTNSFEVALRFNFNLKHRVYYGVKYDFRNSLTFLGNTPYEFDNLGVSTNGDSYSFDIELSPYQANPFDYYSTLPTLTDLIYGVKGLQFLQDYYILGDNPRVSGTYYVNYNNLVSKFINMTSGQLASAGADLTFKTLNGEYYDHIQIDAHKGGSGAEYNTQLWITYSNAYARKTIYHVVWDGEHFLNQLEGDYSAYYTIDVLDSTYDLNVYKALAVGYLSYYSAPSVGIEGGSITGNVFDLLGNAFGSLSGVLAIEVFPNMSLGLLLTIPFIGLVLFFIIGLFKR